MPSERLDSANIPTFRGAFCGINGREEPSNVLYDAEPHEGVSKVIPESVKDKITMKTAGDRAS